MTRTSVTKASVIRQPQPESIQHNISLQPHNTLGLSVSARYFAEVSTLTKLREVVFWAQAEALPVLPLGGGSNIVLAGDYHGLVIQLALKERRIVKQGEKLLVTAGAGENWHDFVQWTIQHGCFGLENLSLIPGSVGAAPIQNIGAYGVEIKDRFHSLVAMDIHTCELVTYTAEQCRFDYRDSVFKGADRNRFVIVSVTFVLDSHFVPQLDYGHLRNAVAAEAAEQPITAQLVSAVVCRTRSQKLPDPAVVGNAGSFFKNPLIDDAHHQKLLTEVPDLVAYPSGAQWKLAAGWLIERCGFKGVTRESGAGVYPLQALVLVNNGGATGSDILGLAKEIQEAVYQRFGVELEIEPQIYP